jgi:hypothetical protein
VFALRDLPAYQMVGADPQLVGVVAEEALPGGYALTIKLIETHGPDGVMPWFAKMGFVMSRKHLPPIKTDFPAQIAKQFSMKVELVKRICAVAFLYEYSVTKLEQGKRGNSIGLYQYLCMINHSCKPKTMWVMGDAPDAKDRPVCHLLALRPIKAGEELTVSYQAHMGIDSYRAGSSFVLLDLFNGNLCRCGTDVCLHKGRTAEQIEKTPIRGDYWTTPFETPLPENERPSLVHRLLEAIFASQSASNPKAIFAPPASHTNNAQDTKNKDSKLNETPASATVAAVKAAAGNEPGANASSTSTVTNGPGAKNSTTSRALKKSAKKKATKTKSPAAATPANPTAAMATAKSSATGAATGKGAATNAATAKGATTGAATAKGATTGAATVTGAAAGTATATGAATGAATGVATFADGLLGHVPLVTCESRLTQMLLLCADIVACDGVDGFISGDSGMANFFRSAVSQIVAGADTVLEESNLLLAVFQMKLDLAMKKTPALQYRSIPLSLLAFVYT